MLKQNSSQGVWEWLVSAKKKSLKKVAGLFFGVVIVVVVAWMLLGRFLSVPNIGTVHSGTVPAKTASFDQGSEQKRFDGTYVAFPYPGAFSEKRHETPTDGPVKERIFLAADDLEGKKIAVTVEESDNGRLDGNSSYSMRMSQERAYVKSSFSTKDGLTGYIFEKNTPVFEETAFFMDANRAVSVSCTSSFGLGTLREDLMHLLDGVQLKK